MGMKKKDGKRSQTKIAFSSMQVPREAVVENSNVSSSKLSSSYPLSDFTVDNSTYSSAQIRAAFYPKFENEKSDQEIRIRMIEVVSNGLATMEVSLKHSGSLFMYAGHKGGAFAKNSYGNKYTAVGVFVLGQMFHEAWGRKAGKKQAKFNDFLERNSMCVSMELVTAVLGDHGQRPREDYVVVTAVTELGNGKPKFYSTPNIIAFCRKWRLPTNHVWLFSTRKSVTSFFAAYDALCEEGTATSVCKAIDEVSDISIPGSKDHVKVQGEILEGLVARIVSRESFNHMENVMRNFPPPRAIGAGLDLGPSLREIYAANRSNEKEQLKALLQNVGSSFCPDNVDWFRDARSKEAHQSVISFFLQAHPADYSTAKLQEIIRLMRKRSSGGSYEFKCYSNFHKLDSSSADNLHFKVIVHIKRDKFFQQYQKEMRNNPGVWPIYRGFFVDINLFKANNEGAADIVKNVDNNSSSGTSGMDGLADEDENLMLKLKFVPYMLRTFLIRNGLSILLKNGQDAYKTYYLKQLKKWGTSPRKKRQLSEMLDEWAGYIKRKYEKKQSIGVLKEYYLSEAEPFLEQYAKRSPQNQALVGCAGNLVRVEDILAIVEEDGDEEGDLETQMVVAPSSPNHSVKEDVGLIVFFPGIPGCAKSALCKEIVSSPEALGDDRPVKSMMGDLVKGKYWQKLANERVKKPYSIMLADKNAPNEEVWTHIEDICQMTKAAAVPVIPDTEGTESNPFSLDVLAVFMFRVLQRVNHPGKLDKNCPTAGYVLLMFYHLYEGKTRQEFESELIESFGSLVKIPVLKSKRHPLPDQVKCVMEEGIKLYKRHFHKHGRNDCTKGTLASDWVNWEKKLRETLFGHAQYLNSIQVPFDSVLKQVVEQLKTVAKGECKIPNSGKRKLGSIVYAAVSIPVKELQSFLYNMTKGNKEVESFFKHMNLVASLRKAHVTLAHKKSRGVAAVASYAVFLHREVPVEIIALLFSDKMAALEVRLGSIDGETISSKNAWPHITLWTAKGVSANDANMLPELFSEGKVIRIDINPVVSILGTLEFF